MKTCDLSIEYIRSRLSYDPDTGIFIWKEFNEFPSHWNKKYAGTVAGCLEKSWGDKRRFKIAICEREYRAHHLAWFIYYGEYPKSSIDHINGNALDNRISNLRLASKSENGANRSKTLSNKSGFKGVSWHKKANKWVAQVTKDYKLYYLGLYENIDDAKIAYREAAEKLFGEFAKEGN